MEKEDYTLKDTSHLKEILCMGDISLVSRARMLRTDLLQDMDGLGWGDPLR